MTTDILANELTDEQYAELTDEQAAAVLNEMPPPGHRLVPVEELLSGAYQTGIYARLLTAQRDDKFDPVVYGELTALLNLLNSPIKTIDLTSAAAARMMAALAGAGLIDAEETQSIAALAVVPARSRAHELGFADGVTKTDVTGARALLAAREVEAGRRAAFAALRERLITGYHAALASLGADEASGKDAPEWDDVIRRM